MLTLISFLAFYIIGCILAYGSIFANYWFIDNCFSEHCEPQAHKQIKEDFKVVLLSWWVFLFFYFVRMENIKSDKELGAHDIYRPLLKFSNKGLRDKYKNSYNRDIQHMR